MRPAGSLKDASVAGAEMQYWEPATLADGLDGLKTAFGEIGFYADTTLARCDKRGLGAQG